MFSMSHQTPRRVKMMLRPFYRGNVGGAFARLNLSLHKNPCVLNLLNQNFYMDKSKFSILGGLFLTQEDHEICLLLLYKQTVKITVFLVYDLCLGRARSLLLLKKCKLVMTNALKLIVGLLESDARFIF